MHQRRTCAWTSAAGPPPAGCARRGGPACPRECIKGISEQQLICTLSEVVLLSLSCSFCCIPNRAFSMRVLPDAMLLKHSVH
jgi:hypothetical protein